MPSKYVDKGTDRICPLILEISDNILASELQRVIRKVMMESPHLDVEKVAFNLLRYRDYPLFDGILKEIQGVMAVKPGYLYSKKARQILQGVSAEKDKDPQ
ncbi:MAG: hypothetical protein GF309_13455 [Candidatus Lokiarchaeota archaeon]|nr:hypothetical protein [Candidatus Lokiarchaeota archaeon]